MICLSTRLGSKVRTTTPPIRIHTLTCNSRLPTYSTISGRRHDSQLSKNYRHLATIPHPPNPLHNLHLLQRQRSPRRQTKPHRYTAPPPNVIPLALHPLLLLAAPALLPPPRPYPSPTLEVLVPPHLHPRHPHKHSYGCHPLQHHHPSFHISR